MNLNKFIVLLLIECLVLLPAAEARRRFPAFAAAGPSYLFGPITYTSTDAAPSGMTPGGSGTFTFNNSSPSLNGESFNMSATTFNSPTYVIAFTARDEVWCYVQWQVATTFASSRWSIRDGSNNVVANFAIDTATGKIGVSVGTGGATLTVNAMSVGTPYQLMFHYKKGSGANALGDVEWEPIGTAWGTDVNRKATVTNGDATAQCAQFFYLYNNNFLQETQARQIGSATVFGNNP